MEKQPTFQSHQSVQVMQADHPRAYQVGSVVDVRELERVIGTRPGEKKGEKVDVLAPAVIVKFDDDSEEVAVAVSALRALK